MKEAMEDNVVKAELEDVTKSFLNFKPSTRHWARWCINDSIKTRSSHETVFNKFRDSCVDQLQAKAKAKVSATAEKKIVSFRKLVMLIRLDH